MVEKKKKKVLKSRYFGMNFQSIRVIRTEEEIEEFVKEYSDKKGYEHFFKEE